MGLEIGSIGATGVTYALRQPVTPVPTYNDGGVAASEAGATPTLLGQRRPEDTPKVGFGDGTLSPAGAALKTLDRTIDATRSMFDALEEVRRRIRANAERTGASPANATLVDTTAQLNQHRTNTALTVRTFINSVNETAGISQARANGETPPVSDNTGATQATFLVNGQTFSATLAPAAPRLNLLA